MNSKGMQGMCRSPFVPLRTGVLSRSLLYLRKCIVTARSSFISSGMQQSCKQHNLGRSGNHIPYYLSVNDHFKPEECEVVVKDMIVHEDFLSEFEENVLFSEIEPYLNRLRYESDHWDDAIHGFRETERLHWTKPSTEILERVKSVAFLPGKSQLKHVHVLDLSENGYIKPHIDSVRFCGDTIAGLSLLSDCVMKLVHDKDKKKTIDVLLKRRSLYIMRNSARYDYTHEVMAKESSKFEGRVVPRGRRISVICRSEVVS